MRQDSYRLTRARNLSLLIWAAGMALILAGCAQQDIEEESGEIPTNVRVMTIGVTDLREYFEISGPVEPVRGADISSEESGKVAYIHLDKGQTVKKGEVLIELNRKLLKAELKAAEAELELQRYNYEQTKQLHEANKVSRFEFLTTESQFEQAAAFKEIAEQRYTRAAVKAPFSGLVTDRFVEPGELVAPGMLVSRVIDPYTLKLVGSLTEREVGWVRPGTEAEVVLDGYEWPVTGLVYWVGFEADRTTGKFEVEIHIDNADLDLRSGVVGRARVTKQEHADVVAIPRGAVVPLNGEMTVFTVEGDIASTRTIQLGSDQGLMVIVKDGLNPGERIVVRGQRDLVDGARVQITEEATAADGSNGTDPAEVRGERATSTNWQEQEDGA